MEILLFVTQIVARRSSAVLPAFDEEQENVNGTREIMGKFALFKCTSLSSTFERQFQSESSQIDPKRLNYGQWIVCVIGLFNDSHLGSLEWWLRCLHSSVHETTDQQIGFSWPKSSYPTQSHHETRRVGCHRRRRHKLLVSANFIATRASTNGLFTWQFSNGRRNVRLLRWNNRIRDGK